MDKPFPAYQGDQPFVFVCYAHADHDVVYPEIGWLQGAGINLWYDEGISAGRIWREEIGNAIKGATSVLYYVSRSSLDSDHCNREINFAIDHGKVVLPIYLNEVALTTDLELGLGRVQALYRETDSDYRNHLLGALGENNTKAEPRPISTHFGARARKWAAGLSVAALLVAGWLYQQGTESADQTIMPSPASEKAPLTAIAVIPFDDLSPDGDQSWLANGMAEALIEALSRIDELRVPGRTSTTSLKLQGATIQQIGEQLNVGTAVEGSIRRVGDQLSVVVQWIRVADEKHLWSARYEREFDDVFDMQREITVGIAEAIRTELAIKDTFGLMIPTRYQASDPRAWESVQKGLELQLQFTSEGYAASFQPCRRAIEIDPTYAQAYTCLAWSYYHWLSPARDVAKGVELAEKALTFDSNDILAHNILAYESFARWEFTNAEERLKRSMIENPMQVFSDGVYLPLLWSLNRHHDALARARESVAIEPYMGPALGSLSSALIRVGDYDAGIDLYERAMSLGTSIGNVPDDLHAYVGMAYHRAGQSSEAVEALLRYVSDLPQASVRLAYEQGGWEEMNLYIARELPLARYEGSCQSGFLAQAGMRDSMYECLEDRLEARDMFLPTELSKQAIAYEAYWEEPRYREFMLRLDEQVGRESSFSEEGR